MSATTLRACSHRLIQAADGDLDAAQRGIVYIDEIDKIQTGGSGFKDMRLGVQHAFSKILEGTVATVPPEGGYKHPHSLASPSTRPTSCSSAAGRSWGWKTSSPSGSGGVGLGLVRWLKTARWQLMGCCGRSSRKTWKRSG